MDDGRLLRQYLEEGSEAAFGRLVDRHLKMVYYTCRRELGCDQLAEDATQVVFLNLARYAASIRHGASITSWLFAAARNASRNSNRSEARRRRYEEEAAKAMQESESSKPSWESVEPWLNDGLAQLSAGDRDLLLWRFFEGASLADVARACGIEEPAARKRVSRALDRLRQYLSRKEATVTSALLLAWLSEHSAKAAPAGCQASVLQALKSHAPTSLLHTPNPIFAKGLLLVSTTKTIAASAAAVVFLLGIGFYAYHRAHALPPGVVWQAPPQVGQPSQFAWNVPAASDEATQQAEQQIHSVLYEYLVGNPQEEAAALSPNARHYASWKRMLLSQHGTNPSLDQQYIVDSFTITGSTAVVPLWMYNADGRHTWVRHVGTLEDTTGKWLLTGMRRARHGE